MRVLVVEDSRVQAKGLQRFLKGVGHDVTLAFDGLEGLAAARTMEPEVIIADIVMPNMDGFQMCRAIRKEDRLRAIPVVMLTSLTDPRDIIRGLEAGADCYVSKPYSGKVLLSRIRTVMSVDGSNGRKGSGHEIEVELNGVPYTITAERLKILTLLLSTYEDAILQNEKLRNTKAELVVLNTTLERKVTERTSALEGEITERKKAQQEREKLIRELTSARDALHYQATHDELTGQWNRSAIFDTLKKELARSQRDGTSVGVIIMDVDHFKRVNDTKGHLAGDAALRAIAKRIESVVRPYDSAGRYGGEEFIVVLPGCDMPNARLVAERLRLSFARESLQTDEGVIGVTMSLGVATTEGRDSTHIDTVIRAADEALYRAKNKGRNRLELARVLANNRIARVGIRARRPVRVGDGS